MDLEVAKPVWNYTDYCCTLQTISAFNLDLAERGVTPERRSGMRRRAEATPRCAVTYLDITAHAMGSLQGTTGVAATRRKHREGASAPGGGSGQHQKFDGPVTLQGLIFGTTAAAAAAVGTKEASRKASTRGVAYASSLGRCRI